MSSVKNSIPKITQKKSGPWDHRLHKVILALGRGLMESPNMDFYLRHKWHFVLLLRCAAQVPKSDFDIESSLKGLASGPQKSKIEGQKFCLGFRCSLRCQSDLWRHFVGPPLSGKKIWGCMQPFDSWADFRPPQQISLEKNVVFLDASHNTKQHKTLKKKLTFFLDDEKSWLIGRRGLISQL